MWRGGPKPRGAVNSTAAMPVVEFLEEVMRSGFRHHAALCPGDHVAEVSLLADELGARKVVL